MSTESERKPLKKKRLVWFRGEFMREHVAVNSRCTIIQLDLYSISNMANHSFIFVVGFRINDWKENVGSLNNSSFWEETQSFLCDLSEWDNFFVASSKCCQQRLRSRWTLFICSALFLTMLTYWQVQFLKTFTFLFLSIN